MRLQWVDEGDQDHLGSSEYHEPDLTKWITEFPGQTFVDVGAHVGRYAVRCSQNFQQVYAFEPFAANREKLRRNCSLNGVENVAVFSQAAWSIKQKLELKVTNNGNASLTCVPDPNGSVRGWPLSLLVPWRGVTLMKIDVEGGEFEALVGAHDILTVSQPTLIIEVHEHLVEGMWDDLERLLKNSYDYQTSQFPSHMDSIYMLAEPR